MLDEKISYQSANVIPVKVLHDTDLVNNLRYAKKVIPRVIQVTPTNSCDLNCGYCCCSEIDRKEKLSLCELKEIVDIAVSIGVKAMVVTGGGEPMTHPDIIEFLDYATNKLKVSLITNGNHFQEIQMPVLKKLQWCRISFDNERKLTKKYSHTLKIASMIKNVNFSFSYVYMGKHHNDFLQIMEFLNASDNFSHIRIVNDSLSREFIDTFDAEEYLKEHDIDTSKCFFKKQQIYSRGQKKCYMSLLKPRIVASGDVYPCCAIQYQKANGLKMYNPKLSMGHYTDLPKLYEKQEFFDGSICDQCYYEGYNNLLSYYLEGEKIKDKEFI